jgi:PIN domain nuclease of toxin-antitoxin system
VLDTHALLWACRPGPHPCGDPRRHPVPGDGPVRVRGQCLEIGTKHRLGTSEDAAPVVSGYPEHLRALRAELVPITGHHALTAGTLQWSHRDRFDRVVVAQAMLGSLPVVTSDPVLAAFPGISTVW